MTSGFLGSCRLHLCGLLMTSACQMRVCKKLMSIWLDILYHQIKKFWKAGVQLSLSSSPSLVWYLMHSEIMTTSNLAFCWLIFVILMQVWYVREWMLLRICSSENTHFCCVIIHDHQCSQPGPWPCAIFHWWYNNLCDSSQHMWGDFYYLRRCLTGNGAQGFTLTALAVSSDCSGGIPTSLSLRSCWVK